MAVARAAVYMSVNRALGRADPGGVEWISKSAGSSGPVRKVVSRSWTPASSKILTAWANPSNMRSMVTFSRWASSRLLG